jgi:hypothetical protein
VPRQTPGGRATGRGACHRARLTGEARDTMLIGVSSHHPWGLAAVRPWSHSPAGMKCWGVPRRGSMTTCSMQATGVAASETTPMTSRLKQMCLRRLPSLGMVCRESQHWCQLPL